MNPIVITLAALAVLAPYSVAAADLKETDTTSKWSYPYTAPAEKEKRIREGVEALVKGQPGTPVAKFIEALGLPDQITDLSKGFAGMSPNEDGMLVQYRNQLSYRLVWFISKKNKNTANLEDVWFAAYVEKGSDGVLKIANWHDLPTWAKVALTIVEALFVPDLKVLKEHVFTRAKTESGNGV